MKRMMSGLLLSALLAGCAQTQPGAYQGGIANDRGFAGAGGVPGMHSGVRSPQAVGNLMGPHGQPIPMRGGSPSTAKTPGEAYARSTFAGALPTDVVRQVLHNEDSARTGAAKQNLLLAGGPIPPTASGMTGMPGMGLGAQGQTTMPGPVPPRGSGVPGAVAAVAPLNPKMAGLFSAKRTSVRFSKPNGMRISWYAPGADGKAKFTTSTLTVPGRYNFQQASIYRLKMTNIPGRPGVALYPTLEVVPGNAKTATFLAHSTVPVVLTQEDFDQVLAGNYLVKVIYLPYPQFQDFAAIGINEVVSTRLEPGQDPIEEAKRRGHILLVLRMGNIKLEDPNTPAMDAPGAGGGTINTLPMPKSRTSLPPQAGMMNPNAMMPPRAGMMNPNLMMPPRAGMPPSMGTMMPPTMGGMMPPSMMGRPGMLPGSPMVPGTLPVNVPTPKKGTGSTSLKPAKAESKSWLPSFLK